MQRTGRVNRNQFLQAKNTDKEHAVRSTEIENLNVDKGKRLKEIDKETHRGTQRTVQTDKGHSCKQSTTTFYCHRSFGAQAAHYCEPSWLNDNLLNYWSATLFETILCCCPFRSTIQVFHRTRATAEWYLKQPEQCINNVCHSISQPSLVAVSRFICSIKAAHYDESVHFNPVRSSS